MKHVIKEMFRTISRLSVDIIAPSNNQTNNQNIIEFYPHFSQGSSDRARLACLVQFVYFESIEKYFLWVKTLSIKN